MSGPRAVSLSATDKRALQVLRTRMTFAELADALGVKAATRRRTLDGRLQDMVRAGLVMKVADGSAPTRIYQTTSAGARKLAAAVSAERRRSRPPRRETTETEREDWGW